MRKKKFTKLYGDINELKYQYVNYDNDHCNQNVLGDAWEMDE